MKAHRARRLFAVSAIGVLMAGGAAIGAAGTASAAVPANVSTNVSTNFGRGCSDFGRNGWWNNNCDFRFGNRGDFNNGAVVVIVVG
ncbi:hypothetical protein ABZV31_02395 [Streptomyces sp. NPDC005202]|uniref:hypothetical protein n=1 Tax=Streptomyces sp. NPDC005202 TaxID=3157021 RepID=UPI0033AC677D